MLSSDESNNDDGRLSDHSDGGDLPSFPHFSSPHKFEEQPPPSVSSPDGYLSASLSAATLNTPEKSVPPKMEVDHLSPHTSYTDRKALEKVRKLARKATELARHIKVKTERNEKVESYIRSGGVRALSEEWEETKRREESLSDGGEVEGPDRKKSRTSSSDGELTACLPRNPPGRTFFVKQPDFITELYPPCYEDDPTNNITNTMFSNVEGNLLTQQDPTVLRSIICSEWLTICYVQKPCPPTVWQWLFQIMCRSHDQEVSSGAFRSLTSLLQTAKRRENVASIHVPSLSDIIDILIHLGADPSFVNGSLSEPMEEDNVFEVSTPLRNLSHLLQFLTMCLKSGLESCYNTEDIEKLIVVLARMSLDRHICGEIIQCQVSLCLAALVAAVPDSKWTPPSVRLVSRITILSEHHHDKLYLTRLMTGTSQRLHHLQKELCRKSLEQITEMNASNSGSDSDIIRHVVEHFRSLRCESFDHYYLMYSAFSLVALLMHPAEVIWTSAEERKELSMSLGNLSSTRIRDNPEHPERSVVKDLVIRLMLEVKSQKDKTATCKQQDLFAYAS